MGQERWVSYIFRYRNNTKCESAGFIKIQKVYHKSEELSRMQIGLKLYKKKGCKCKIYLIQGENQAKYVTDILVKPVDGDTIVEKLELPWENTLGDGWSMEDYNGVFFFCDDGEMLVSPWNDVDIRVQDIRIEKAEKESERKQNYNKENIQDENSHIAIQMNDCTDSGMIDVGKTATENVKGTTMEPVEEELETAYTEEKTDDYMQICENMVDSYPKLPLYPDSEFIECVKIVPHDIGKLAMGNWKLGANSFVSHGYYHYRYLMLGKVKIKNEEIYVIGVPGVFNNKERYVANAFGFTTFIPVKKTNILTGNFGYWVFPVARE